MRAIINNACFDILIDYNNELLLNDNKIIFSNDSNLFNNFDENTDIIIIDIINYNIYNHLFDNIKEIIIYDNILNDIITHQEKLKSKNNIYIIGKNITLNINKFINKNISLNINSKIIYIPTEIEQMLNNTNNNIIINTNFINKCVEYNNKDYIKNIFAKSLLLCIIGGNDTFQNFKKYFEEKNYIEIIKMSLQISKILNEEHDIYNDSFTNSIIISSNKRLPNDIAKLYDVMITYKIFYNDKISGINEYIYDYIPNTYKHMLIKYDDFVNNIVNSNINKLNLVLIEKPGNLKTLCRNLEDIDEYVKYSFKEYF